MAGTILATWDKQWIRHTYLQEFSCIINDNDLYQRKRLSFYFKFRKQEVIGYVSWGCQGNLQTGECICDRTLLLLNLDTIEKLSWPCNKKVIFLQYGEPHECSHSCIWLQLQVCINLSVGLESLFWPPRSQPIMNHISLWSLFSWKSLPRSFIPDWVFSESLPCGSNSLGPFHVLLSDLSCICGLLLLILQTVCLISFRPPSESSFAHFSMILFWHPKRWY